MKFETGFGVLNLPRSECVRCIAADRYMLCTICEFKETMMLFALSVVNRKVGDLNIRSIFDDDATWDAVPDRE